jgi:integrase
LIYRLAIENKKVASNPARLLKHRREADGRVRFLNQSDPHEEARLRKVMAAKFPEHIPELDIAIHTGLRRGEQYRRIDWSCVDLARRDLFVPQSKNGRSRHIGLNKAALAAFEELRRRTEGKDPIFASRNHGDSLRGPRHWFEDAAREAGLKNFTWHDLRHTFASRLVMTGTDLRTVADLLGHANIQMTMRYAHLAPAHKQAAVDRLDAFAKGPKSGIVRRSKKRAQSEGKKSVKPTSPESATRPARESDPSPGERTDTKTSTAPK